MCVNATSTTAQLGSLLPTQNGVLNSAHTPEHVVNFFNGVAQETREIMAKLGVRKLDDLIGRPEFLKQRHVPDHPKANSLISLPFSRTSSMKLQRPSTSRKRVSPASAQRNAMTAFISLPLIYKSSRTSRSSKRFLISQNWQTADQSSSATRWSIPTVT